MKKFILYPFFLALGMMAMVSCSDKDDDENPGGSAGETEELGSDKYDPNTMTEEEYLEDTGIKVANLFKASDQKPLIQLLNYMADTYEDYEFPDFDEEDMFRAARHLANALANNPANIGRAVYSYELSLSQIAGVWEPNDRREEWVKTADSKDFILRFPYKGDEAEFKLAGSGSEWDLNYVEEDYYYGDKEYYTVKVPSTLKLTVVAGSDKYVDAVANTEYKESSNCKATVDAKVMNLNVAANMNCTNTQMTENTTLSVSGTKALMVSVALDGKNLLDPETWEDEEDSFDALKSGSVDINVIGNVLLKSQISNFEAFVANAESYFETEQDAKRAAKELNKSVSAEMYFSGVKTPMGSIEWEAAELTYEDYYTYTYWGVVPTLALESTGSTVSLDRFFSEKNFGDLYDLVESIVKSYERLWK